MKLFGKQKTSHDQVLTSLDELRKAVEEISTHSQALQIKVKNEMKEALIKQKQGNKSGALLSLKRMILYETQFRKLEGSTMNLGTPLFLEGAIMNKNKFDSLSSGNQVLKHDHSEMGIEDFENLEDEKKEQQDMLSELNDVMLQPVGMLKNIYDVNLMSQFDALGAKDYKDIFLD